MSNILLKNRPIGKNGPTIHINADYWIGKKRVRLHNFSRRRIIKIETKQVRIGKNKNKKF